MEIYLIYFITLWLIVNTKFLLLTNAWHWRSFQYISTFLSASTRNANNDSESSDFNGFYIPNSNAANNNKTSNVGNNSKTSNANTDDDDDNDIFDNQHENLDAVLESHGLSKEDDDGNDPEFHPSANESEESEEESEEEQPVSESEEESQAKNEASKEALPSQKEGKMSKKRKSGAKSNSNGKSASAQKNDETSKVQSPSLAKKPRKTYKRKHSQIQIQIDGSAKLPDQVITY